MLEDKKPSRLERRVKLVETFSLNVKPERHVIGITGPPGVGKSTLISQITQYIVIKKNPSELLLWIQAVK